MKKILRWTVLGTVTVLALLTLLIAGIFVVQPQRYKDFVEQQVIAAAQRSRVGLRIGGSELSPFKVTAHQVQILPPRSLLYFDFDRIELRPSLMSFLTGVPHAAVNATLYEGTLAADLDYEIAVERGGISATLDGLSLPAHPQLAGFGLQSGILKASLQNGKFNPVGLEHGELSLNLSNVEKPQATSLPLKSFGLPFNVDIPPVLGLSADAQATLQNRQLTIKSFSLDCSLGSARFSGKADLGPTGRLQDWLLDGSVELSDEGRQRFGQYLPLVSNGTLDETVQRFRVSIRNRSGFPDARFSRM